MWICDNCENQNEEGFNFCWSCGQPRPRKTEVESNDKPEPKPVEEKKPEINKPIPKVKNLGLVDDFETNPDLLNQPLVDQVVEKPEIVTPVERKPTKTIEPELFTTFTANKDNKPHTTEAEIDWQFEIFTIAVRLIGLYFVLQVILLLPELVWYIYLIFVKGEVAFTAFPGFFESALFFFIAKFLFYLILGIYLIAGGNLIIRLLPNR